MELEEALDVLGVTRDDGRDTVSDVYKRRLVRTQRTSFGRRRELRERQLREAYQVWSAWRRNQWKVPKRHLPTSARLNATTVDGRRYVAAGPQDETFTALLDAAVRIGKVDHISKDRSTFQMTVQHDGGDCLLTVAVEDPVAEYARGSVITCILSSNLDGQSLDAEPVMQLLAQELATMGPDEPRNTPDRAQRASYLTRQEAATAVAEFEAPLSSLTNLTQGGGLPPWDEDFIRNTIEQIYLWRQRDEASPQIFELLIADIVKRFVERLADPRPLRSEMLRLGADEHVADVVSHQVAEAISTTTELGGSDGTLDAELLEQIADSTERTAEALEAIRPTLEKGQKSFLKRAAERVVVEGATAAGREASRAVLAHFRSELRDEWPKLQIALMMAWRAVRDIFVRV